MRLINAISTTQRLLFRLLGHLAPAHAARKLAAMIADPGGRNPAQAWESAPGPVAREIEPLPGLYARSWGDDGPLVLAVHGWRGRPLQFLPLATALLARGFRTIALDLPGHGRSCGRATPRSVGGLIAAVADRLGPVHAVVGHSFGGAVLGSALLQGLATPRLVVIASPAQLSRLPLAMARALKLPERAVGQLMRILEQQAGRPPQEFDLADVAPRSGLPGLIVHDRDDPAVPFRNAEELSMRWPQAHLVATHGLGHRDVLADPPTVAAVTAFITDPGA